MGGQSWKRAGHLAVDHQVRRGLVVGVRGHWPWASSNVSIDKSGRTVDDDGTSARRVGERVLFTYIPQALDGSSLLSRGTPITQEDAEHKTNMNTLMIDEGSAKSKPQIHATQADGGSCGSTSANEACSHCIPNLGGPLAIQLERTRHI